MPTTGYDDDAARIGLNFGHWTRRRKLALLVVFLAAIGVGALIAYGAKIMLGL